MEFHIKYIMGAKNFTEEQAVNFYASYEAWLKANDSTMNLYDFVVKSGISPEISQEIIDLISDK